MLQTYADEQLSARLTLTPERFLIARDAVLGRCGEQVYGAHEVPTIEPDNAGMVTVTREPSEVFHPHSLQTFAGKPVVLLHPDDYVDASNIRQHQIGSIMSARQGEGENSDFVVGDLMLTDERAISLVRDGSYRSLSLGYVADYQPLGRGRARQRDIQINHLALLPTGMARCGDRCIIRDSKPTKGRHIVRTRDQPRDPINQRQGDPYDRNLNFNVGANVQSGDPQGEIGGELVMRLPPPLSAYYLAADLDGNPALFKLPLPGLDPGQGSMGNSVAGRLPATTRDYAAVQQLANADRERGRAASSAMLRAINRSNAEAWQKHGW
jgi:hypothetical protein